MQSGTRAGLALPRAPAGPDEGPGGDWAPTRWHDYACRPLGSPRRHRLRPRLPQPSRPLPSGRRSAVWANRGTSRMTQSFGSGASRAGHCPNRWKAFGAGSGRRHLGNLQCAMKCAFYIQVHVHQPVADRRLECRPVQRRDLHWKGAAKPDRVPTTGEMSRAARNVPDAAHLAAGRATAGSMVRQRSMRWKPLYSRQFPSLVGWDRGATVT